MRNEILFRRSLWQVVGTGVLFAVPLSGCGGPAATQQPAQAAAAPKPVAADEPPTEKRLAAKESAPEATPEPKKSGPTLVRALPTACESGVEPCSAPLRFVEQVCHGRYPDLALVMLSKGTPWRRGYLKVETLEPVNIYEGERSEQWLSFGEEVLVLRTRGPGGHGGVQVSGPTDVDILRWDGTCATIRQEMLAPYPTNTTIATPRVAWKYLSEPIQAALLTSQWVQAASDKERPACRGSTMKHPDAACDKASRKLTETITVALRGGLALPVPEKLPAWRDEQAMQ